MRLLAGTRWIDQDELPADAADLGDTVGHVAGAVAAFAGVWTPDSPDETSRLFTFKADGHLLDRDLPASDLDDRDVLEVVEDTTVDGYTPGGGLDHNSEPGEDADRG